MDNGCMLLKIAKKGFSLDTSTIKLSGLLKISQQSVSRKLMELEKAGLIRRESSPRGIRIRITPCGKVFLRKRYLELESIFKGTQKISGRLVSSLGEGKYYIMQKGYARQIREKLGFKPFPGTLNIKTDDFPVNSPLEINGFKTKERSFGALDCYPVKIGKITGAVVVPKRTHHKGILEVIAPVFLRRSLSIKDGDKVTVEVIK